MNRLGFRAHDFGKFDSVEELILCIKEKTVGIQSPFIQFAPSKVIKDFPSIIDEELAQKTGQKLKENDISVAVLGCYINPVHPDQDKLESDLTRFENNLKVAKLLNTKIVGTETGSNKPEPNYKLFYSSIERLLNTAIKYDSIVAIEAVAFKDTIDDAIKMRKVMDYFNSPNLKVILDPINILPLTPPQNQKAYFEEVIDLLAPFVCALHVKDFKKNEDGTLKKDLPVGEGELDWKQIAKILNHHNITAPLLLENFNPQTLNHSIAYVNESFGLQNRTN